MSVLFTAGPIGSPLPGSTYNQNWNLLEASFLDLGPYVISGLVPTIGTGLAVNVSAGKASIGGQVNVAGSFIISGLAPSTTNHLYLLQNGTGTSNTTGTAPAASVKLGTATTGVATVTSVDTSRAAGRQAFVSNDALVTLDTAQTIAGAKTFTAIVTITPPINTDALSLGVNGNNGITLLSSSGTNKRVRVNLNNCYQLGTDAGNTNATDLWLFNQVTSNNVLTASATDLVTIGSSNASGGAVLGVAAGKVGFFGTAPSVKATIADQAALAATASFADVDARLDTLRTKLNALLGELRTKGLIG